MAKKTLTPRHITALKSAPAGTRYQVMDAIVPNLGVRVSDKGQRTFILMTRFPGSRNPTRRAIGDVGALSLDQARQRAREWLDLIAKGIDPQERLEDERTSAQERRANTFGAIAETYIARQVAEQRRARITEREIRRELISRWQDKPITAITRKDVIALVDEILDRGAKRHAHNILGLVRVIFNWAINRGTYGIEQSPCDRLRPATLIGEKAIRQRVLGDAEIRAIWKAAEQLAYPYGPFLRLLMLTGQRKAEVAEAQWREIDFDKAIWVIPEERFKSGSAHIVPLTPSTIALLQSLPRFKTGDFLFSGTGGAKPINGFSKGKATIDGLLPGDVESWQFHDIRRTVRTRLSELRVPEHVSEMAIGHARKGLARVYDQHRYAAELREAFEAWERRLRAIVEGRPTVANVISLARA